MVASNPASLSTRQLLRYIEFVEASGQNAERWRHALWRKLIYPLATVVMIFLAVPMVVRSTRAVSSGRRILFGTLLGLAFHVTNQTAAHLGTVFAAPAAMCAVLPTLVLFLIGVALHARTL
jgi:lipopolysaccharide export system permease protein